MILDHSEDYLGVFSFTRMSGDDPTEMGQTWEEEGFYPHERG